MSDPLQTPTDSAILALIKAIEALGSGHYQLELPVASSDLGRLSQALVKLSRRLEERSRQQELLAAITARANAGLLLEDILEFIYADFRSIIPYNRIGLALIEDDGARVRAVWSKSDGPEILLGAGYSAEMQGSSLEAILRTGKPRIINDLEDYLAHKPQSESTRLVVQEGVRSSLTCPLLAQGRPIGFLFFSSFEPVTYAHVHIKVFQEIAGQVAVLVERGRLASDLALKKADLEQRNEELHHLVEFRNFLLGVAAHDLRNPLSFILTTSDLLLGPESDLYVNQQPELLASIARQARHMLNLVNAIMDYSEIESGRLKLRRSVFSLGTYLEGIVEAQNKNAALKGSSVLLESQVDGQVWADSLRLRQILDNLISNAVKFSPPGACVRVHVEPISDGGWRFAIQDEGPGLTAADRERLFQPFTRLSARPTAMEKSSGLGLTITQAFCLAHGGEIGVDSEPGQGACFWFTLPARGSLEK